MLFQWCLLTSERFKAIIRHLFYNICANRVASKGYGQVDMCGTVVAAHTCPLYRKSVLFLHSCVR